MIHKIYRKTNLIFAVFLICCLNSACFFKTYQEEATEYVLEHEDEIRQMIERQEENVLEGAELQKHTDDWTYAAFVLGGISMGDGSTFGFYYTKEDEPYLHWDYFYSEWEEVGENSYKAYDLQHYSDDMTEEEKQACNYYICTSKICDNIWYWCESY